MTPQRSISDRAAAGGTGHHAARWLLAVLVAGLLAACGGAGKDAEPVADAAAPTSGAATPTSGATTPTTGAAAPTTGTTSPTVAAAPAPAPAPAVTVAAKPTAAEASRFLAQSTFGATDADIAAVVQQGAAGWIDAQFAQPQASHKAALDARQVQRTAANEGNADSGDFVESWWQQAATGQDQLRQRVAFALSQIFVVSLMDGNVGQYPRGVAAYYDMLGRNAFGNFRTLLEDVTRHPMMGLYLSHLRNQKESATRVPDENYAREVMQLFSIGLHRLNDDGTPRLNGSVPAETYTTADVQGLAKVFTGFSWHAGGTLTDRTSRRFFGNDAHADRDWQPMQAYNKYAANTDFHSALEKSFLATTIAAQGSNPDADGDLRIALDALFNHANVGPFFCKQMIQRLVTSNPTPAYVARCTAAFNGAGTGGTRGDMKATLRAILLDREARTLDAANTGYGKLREPVLRFAHWLRAFKATSVDANGRFRGIGVTDDPSSSLGQSPMRAPSVFNFYRPGYAPPGTTLSLAGLVAPELQLSHEVSVAGYLNYLRNWVPINTAANRYVRQDYAGEIALAGDPAALVERLDLLLAGAQLSAALKAQIVAAVGSRAVPAAVTNSAGAVTNQAAIDNARQDRVYIAIFLTMASPDYLAQR